MSYLERRVFAVLATTGYFFIQEYQLGGFSYDFAIPKLHLVIEADGRAYHQHASRHRRDMTKTTIAAKAGWELARVSLPDVEGQTASAIARREIEVTGECSAS